MLEAASTQPRIVVIDDQPANTQLVEQILRRSGYEQVQGFTDPEAAMRAIDDTPPDLVMLDLHMPGRDGFSILESIGRRRASGELLPVLVMTADTHPGTRQRALDLGADDFLTKPIDVADVVLRTRNLLYVRQLHQALVARNAEIVDTIGADQAGHGWWTDHRAVVASALARRAPGSSIEPIAAALCDAITEATGARGASILEFRPGGSVMVIATTGIVDGIDAGRLLPDAAARQLRDRAESGLWVAEPGARGALTAEYDMARTTRVYATLQVGTSEVAGVMVVDLGPGRTTDHFAARLGDVFAFRTIASELLGPQLGASSERAVLRQGIELVIAQRALRPVFQPVVDLVDDSVVGHEALTRFADGTRPDHRFADAASVGLGLELELAALTAALAAAPGLPPSTFLSLNVSPELLLEHDRLEGLIRNAPRPVVLELTEHAPVEDYETLRSSIRAFEPPIRVAIDDAGAGYASFRHIVELRPDFVKLDIGIVRSLDQDAPRRALIGGIDYFALKSGCRLIAEGIETEAELASLRDLSVELGQGYLLGRPAALG